MQQLLMLYFIIFLFSAVLGWLLTVGVKKLASFLGIVDDPETAKRKIHKQPIPLLGGLAIFLGFWLVILIVRLFGLVNFIKIPDFYLLIIFLSSFFIVIGGFFDDKYNLKPWQQIIWPLLAAFLTVSGGIYITFITNPIGGSDNEIIYLSAVVGIIISFLWLMGMMYTTKFLDGLDGLVAGVGAIAAIVIFLLSLDWDVFMSATGAMALIFAAILFGFWWHNRYPAKIFLGEGGSILIGYILGVLSIISGSKITTTLLVLGIPVLDVLWVIIWRLWRKESPFSHADQKHLHYQLLKIGFSRRGAVWFLYLVALVFGLVAVYASSFGKLVALVFMVFLMLALLFMIFNFKTDAKN